MFKIGDFSKLSRIPVKTLRYYDEIGLFKPNSVNRYTRYRYYTLEQLPVLHRILGLKELGFSLEQIGQLLSGELTTQQLQKMLRARKREIETQTRLAQAQLAQLEARLQQIERDGQLPHREVVIKNGNASWVAAARGSLSSYDQAEIVFEQLFDQVKTFLWAHDLSSDGPEMIIYPEETDGEEGQLVEACLPVPDKVCKNLPAADNKVHIYRLQAENRLASIVHQDSLATIGEAYRTLLEWMQSLRYRQSGPAREIFLRSPEPDGQCFVEVQIPVCPFTQEDKIMEPKIIHLDAFQVVGMRYFGKNEHNEISQLWDRFIPRLHEIKHIAPGAEVSYGICTGGEAGEPFEYIAALPVSRMEDIPTDMVGKALPAQTYVVVKAHGVADIGPTYDRILQEWLPGSGYQPVDEPDFELYTEEFNPEDPNSPVYIYYPIREG